MSERILLIDDDIELIARVQNHLPREEVDAQMVHDSAVTMRPEKQKSEGAEPPLDLPSTKFSLLKVLSITSEPD